MSQTMMSVTSLNTKIKSLLEATFMHILVEGEVASVTYHSSGHVYFSLKDSDSSIKCVMWRSSAAKMKFRLEQGMHLVIEGSVGVYTPRGEYQFYAVKIEPFGQGALALAYEQLKKKLKEKGYFDLARKQAIPKMIQKVALVTAKESAALQDMLKIIQIRWPLVEVTVVDTLVQGEQAAPQIARALKFADRLHADVVVVGRGGGSTEDLWAFNEEMVADAIFAMKTPVVSAVGHEVDTMISDYVADMRAPTPSAAMEMILPDSQEVLYMLGEYEDRFSRAVQQKVRGVQERLKHAQQIFVSASPHRKLKESETAFLYLEETLTKTMMSRLERLSSLLPELQKGLEQNLRFVLLQKEQYLAYHTKKMEMSDPRLQCKEGWAQVLSGNQPVTLQGLKPDQEFILEDISTKVTALCLDKKSLNTL